MEKEKKQRNYISRRHFLQGMVGGSVTTAFVSGLAGCSDNRRRPEKASIKISFSKSNLPILRSGDVIIVGGSFAAISAALIFARAGRKVVLVESRTYLGREITASLRPWINLGKLSKDRIPDPIAACLNATRVESIAGEIPLKPDAVKLALEDILLNAGVELIYASQPIAVLAEDDTIIGLIIANKSGRQAILGKTVFDATETAAVARAAGSEFESVTLEMFHFNRTVEFDGVRPIQNAKLSVPEDLAIAGNRVTIHRGYRGQGHIYVECPMVLQIGDMDLTGWMQKEIEARDRTMRLTSYLIKNVSQFKKAFLASSSYELHGRHTTRLACAKPDWATDFNSVRINLTDKNLKNNRLHISSFAAPLRQLWCLQEAARLSPAQVSLFDEPVSASLVGIALAQNLIAQWDKIASFKLTRKSTSKSGKVDKLAGALKIKEPVSPQRGRPYHRQPVVSSEVPVLRTADVLVVGGGTSGAIAAITSATEGMRTVLAELNPGLGGTATFGGVDSYWFGRRVGFSTKVQQMVEDVHEGINYRGRKWNIDAKMYALLRQTRRAGVEVFFNAVTIGAVMEKNQVRGVVIATKFGVFAIMAKVVIDATGDGDVAVFAGAQHSYGSVRDHIVMWYSLAQFTRPGRSRNNFTSMVDVSNIEDYTRAILVGRRRGENCHDHGIYIASRETRHIWGDTVLTLTDELKQRHWPDVVNIHFSNYDLKGKTNSDWLRMGLIPPNLEIEIPYRALLPTGLENILIAGKAISATHDALPAIRMQADLENLGGVVALAAAQAIRQRVAPRHINLAVLQKRLVDMGVLPEEVLKRKIKQKKYNPAELKALVDSLSADKPLHSYSDMSSSKVFQQKIPIVDVCTAGESAPAILERALLSAEGSRRMLLAQALAMYGWASCVPTLIDEIESSLAAGSLSPRTSRIRHAGLPPDQGAMPDVVYLMYSLAMTQDKRGLAIWDKVAELFSPTEDDFKDRLKGTFYYVDALCYAAELLGSAEAVPILNKIHRHRSLQNLVIKSGFQPDFVHERRAMLELGLARALARCSSTAGLDTLISYLGDRRAVLAEFAHTTLVAVTGENFGKDASAWSAWLTKVKSSFKPRPLLKRPSG